jgi:hypothetical protein
MMSTSISMEVDEIEFNRAPVVRMDVDELGFGLDYAQTKTFQIEQLLALLFDQVQVNKGILKNFTTSNSREILAELLSMASPEGLKYANSSLRGADQFMETKIKRVDLGPIDTYGVCIDNEKLPGVYRFTELKNGKWRVLFAISHFLGCVMFNMFDFDARGMLHRPVNRVEYDESLRSAVQMVKGNGYENLIFISMTRNHKQTEVEFENDTAHVEGLLRGATSELLAHLSLPVIGIQGFSWVVGLKFEVKDVIKVGKNGKVLMDDKVRNEIDCDSAIIYEDGNGDKRLVAYLEIKSSKAGIKKGLGVQLRRKIPQVRKQATSVFSPISFTSQGYYADGEKYEYIDVYTGGPVFKAVLNVSARNMAGFVNV